MRKKAIVVAVCLVLVGFLAVNGTLAQELGNIFKTIVDAVSGAAPTSNETLLKVELVNQDRYGNTLTNINLSPVYCADGYNWVRKQTNVGGQVYPLWDAAEVQGAQDKFVRVQNAATGVDAKDACFRVAFAVDARIFNNDKLMLNFNDAERNFVWSDWRGITIDGRAYQMIIATYQQFLEPGEFSPPALLQVALSRNVSSADLANLDQNFLRTMVMAVDADTLTPEGGPRPSAIDTLNTTLPIDEITFNPF
ncbi:MAG: hypothetical protein E7323_09940 [Clostridiales bacterium]|nr:hypothetical protein [Clostridiales bacterium]